MQHIQLFMKDFAGRDFGGLFNAVRVSACDGNFLIDMEYSGSRSSKRLGIAALSIDRNTMDELYLLYMARPWKERLPEVSTNPERR